MAYYHYRCGCTGGKNTLQRSREHEQFCSCCSFSSAFEIKSLRTNARDRVSHRCQSRERVSRSRSGSRWNNKGDSKNPISRQLVTDQAVQTGTGPKTFRIVDVYRRPDPRGSHPTVASIVAWRPTVLGGFCDDSDCCGIRHDSTSSFWFWAGSKSR